MNSPTLLPQIQRTLAAIVVTDAVGFSKRMSQDEDRALSIINRDLKLIGELCEFFEGQILKTVGDGVLMYFVSAVQAAACAVEMQKTFNSFVATGKADEHFTHRVGVHLGDIFFNQQDMMGTGVNIAARLESEAKPGAICMSQVVYDVVKSRLDLDASYIGELSLKNINEGVAAYHVWPIGIRPAGAAERFDTGEDSTQAIAPLTITPLNAALQTLSEHPNFRRIKKLLYGTHKAAWENNEAVLEGVALKMLLESLTDRNPTPEECRYSLYRIVGTLNRKAEYSQVAEVILESLHNFYALPTVEQPAHEEADSAASKIVEAPRQVLYQDIADRLDLQDDSIRIKKMLYCLCYDSWESDSNCIVKIRTPVLVETLYQQITTIQGLQNQLRAILLRLNRKAKYAPLADIIFQECQILYPEGNSQISMPGAVDIEETASDNTQINLKKSTKRWTAVKQVAQQSASAPLLPPVLMRPAILGN